MQRNNLTTLLKQNNEYLASNIHTSLPAQVLGFNEQANTVKLEIMVNDTRGENSFEIPILNDVPCQIVQSQNFLITLPIQKGDQGVVIFQEKDCDNWFVNGSKSNPEDARHHDFSDAIFIPGIFNSKRVIPNFDNDGICIRNLNKTIVLKLSNTGIDILGNVNIVGNVNISESLCVPNISGDVKLDGALECAKNIKAADIVSNEISFNSHRHDGVKSGSDISGVPK